MFLAHNEDYVLTVSDYVWIALLIAYSGMAVFAILKTDWTIPAVLAVYSTLLSIIVAEAVVGVLYPPSPDKVPWQPLRHTGVVGDGLPGIEGYYEFTINEIGLRGPPVRLSEMDVKVLCVGGSTTECLYVTDTKSWPWRLGDLLSERLDRKVFVGNAGRSAQFSLHHLYQLQHYPLADRFDWIVALVGLNELSWLVREDLRARWDEIPEKALRRNPRLDATLSYLERRSRCYAVLQGALKAREEIQRDRVAFQDPTGAYVLDRRKLRKEKIEAGEVIRTRLPNFERALSEFEQNLRALAELCRSRDQRLLFLTQPMMWSPDLPQELRDLLWGMTFDHGAYDVSVLSEMIDAMNAVTRRVAREEGTHCVDLASELPKDTTVFYDDCHFNDSGCEKIAQRLSEYLAGQIPG